ncbi:twin-arginine translocation signal domain-containing protein [Desmonostoc muscorum CCALA 125]|nr:twin-arginine translocation signal domain-containing protein [Desmonostoc muscorum CCALA 125]
MDEKNKQSSRRKFIQRIAIAGAAVLLANPLSCFFTNKY